MFLSYPLLKKSQVFLLAAFLTVSALPAQAKNFEGSTIGTLKTTTIEKDQLMMDVAEKYQVGYTQLLAANPEIDPWLPRTGTKVIIPDWHLLPNVPHEGLVLNTAELRIYYFPPGGGNPLTFPIGIGREGLTTPQGTTTIVAKKKDPEWRPTPRMRQEDPELPAVVKAGKDNPLGAYALYLGWPSYRIHGTNKPKAIGRRASSGCIRMYEAQIAWLFKNIPVGTKVTSVNQPVKMGWINGELYLEAEPNDIQIDELEYKNRQITVDIEDGTINRIRRFAGDQVNRVDWEKVRNTLITRSGIPTPISIPAKNAKIYYPIRAANKEDINPVISPKADYSHLVATSILKKGEETSSKTNNGPSSVPQAVANPQRRTDWDDLNGM